MFSLPVWGASTGFHDDLYGVLHCCASFFTCGSSRFSSLSHVLDNKGIKFLRKNVVGKATDKREMLHCLKV